jgi:hypothetical protein
VSARVRRGFVRRASYARIEVEDVFPEDVGKRYLVLHFVGARIGLFDPEDSRRWRIGWNWKLPPCVSVRGILFNVHFLVEVGA